MALQFDIQNGLDLPITGLPEQAIDSGRPVKRVAVLGDDYVGMKPTMEVREGDAVKKGQLLFSDKKTEGVLFTSPVAGVVAEVNRGAKRKFESVVIEASNEEGSSDDELLFESYPDANLAQLDREAVQQNLINSGLWTALRSRPFSKVPAPGTTPHAVFVTAIDTQPLAADPKLIIDERPAEFIAGLQVLSRLTDGVTYLCKAPGVELPGEELGCIEVAEFAGPHPAGLPGTHIHMIAPATLDRQAWHIGYQDVIAVGALFLTGRLYSDRVISLSGPAATNPRLIRTTLGASTEELIAGEVTNTTDRETRVVSGSVFGGRTAAGVTGYLGRYANQVSLLIEGNNRDLVGWMGPGFRKFSIKPIFASAVFSSPLFSSPLLSDVVDKLKLPTRFSFTTATEGSHRAIVPMGMYEKVMPLDILPTPLLKSLAVKDSDTAQMLGCLELDEEDLSLCTFVCPGKIDYGPLLRECLTTIERDG